MNKFVYLVLYSRYQIKSNLFFKNIFLLAKTLVFPNIASHLSTTFSE
jgi:hypothetical protein